MTLQMKGIYNIERLHDLFDQSSLSSYNIIGSSGEVEDLVYVLDKDLKLAHYQSSEEFTVLNNYGREIKVILNDNDIEFDELSENNSALDQFSAVFRLSMDTTIMEVVEHGK